MTLNNAFAVSGTNLFAGTNGGGIFLSPDSGKSWIAANSGLTNFYANTFAVSGTNLFAGTDGGVFISTNNGTGWTVASTGLTDTMIYALAASGENIFAGTQHAGVWRRPLSEMISSVALPLAQVPKQFRLEQNYPNPFNPNTTIKFQLPRTSQVNLSVFDILGREVSVLVNERKNAGSYEVKFDASNLASGVYFYRLQTGNFVDTKKLLLIR